MVEEILSDRAALARAAIEVGSSPPVDRIAPTLDLVERVDLQLDGVRVTVALPGPEPIRLERSFGLEIKRRGCERRLVIEGSGTTKGRPDPLILLAVKRGLRFWAQLHSDEPRSALAFAKSEGVDNRYLGRALQLTFLAPDILEALVAGRQPADFSVNHLFKVDPLPLSWPEQRRAIGIP